MKLNTQAVNLTIVLSLLTIVVDSWARGFNNVTLALTALLIVGSLVQTLAVKSAALQPQPVLVEAVESRKAG